MICEYCGVAILENELHGHMRRHEKEGLVIRRKSPGVTWWDATVTGQIAKRQKWLNDDAMRRRVE